MGVQIGLTLPTYLRFATPQGMIATAQKAEDYGFHSVWVMDHIVIPEVDESRFGAVQYEALSSLAFVAGMTKRIMVGCSVLPIAYRHPLLQAKMIATIDQLSGGRVIYGGAAGHLESEFGVLGVDFHRRGAIADEYLQAIRIAWTEERPEFHGKYVRFSGIRTDPKPLQRPHPTMWVGGDSEAAFRRAFRYGDGWHGRLNATTIAADTRLADVHRVADALGVPRERRRLSLKMDCRIVPEGVAVEERVFFGTVEKVLSDLRAVEAQGVELVVFSPNVSRLEPSMDAIDTIGRELLPRL